MFIKSVNCELIAKIFRKCLIVNYVISDKPLNFSLLNDFYKILIGGIQLPFAFHVEDQQQQQQHIFTINKFLFVISPMDG